MDTPQISISNDHIMHSFAMQYHEELTKNILPFWLNHSIDQQFGGFFTCLDQKGKVYDTDKFVWLQARQIWCFSFMYKNVEANPEWLNMALHGAEFLQKYGRDEKGNWYFSLTQKGQPLLQPYNIFSDCFATMGFAALYKIDPVPEWKKIAIDTFENIIHRKNNPKGKYNKQFPGTRDLKNFSLPMILCNLALELEPILGKERVDEFIPSICKISSLDDVIAVHDGDAILMAQRLAQELGLGVGISSGANFLGALQLLQRHGWSSTKSWCNSD